jgi:dGTPase
MRDDGGFEGNAQTLRILTKLEKFSANEGSNLTRRTLLGILKYPAKYSLVKNVDLSPALCKQTTTIKIIDSAASKPPKCYFNSESNIVEWILKDLNKKDRENFKKIEHNSGKHSKPIHKSFDCLIMNIADDIAYGVHDLEDAIALKLINENQFREDVNESHLAFFFEKIQEYNSEMTSVDTYDSFVKDIFSDSRTRKRQISRLVHYFITNIEIYEEIEFQESLLKYRAYLNQNCRKFLDNLKRLVVERVIKSPGVQHLEFKGQQMVVSVFEALASEPKRLLPEDTYSLYESSESDSGRKRVICDHVAGMTDSFLLKTYDRLFSPRMGSVFDRL